MDAIPSRFKKTRDGVWIADGGAAKFTGLVLEARDLIAQSLGSLNNFGLQLESVRYEGTMGFSGSQSYHSVELVRSAATAIRRTTRRSLTINVLVLSPPCTPL
jgi:hypothetical protein